ncbi:MAG: PA14 domain-containing protein, partial [Flavobacteriales bacterium]
MSHSLPHPSNATELAAITNPLNPSVAVLYSGESAAQNLFDWTSFNTVNSALGISLPGNNVSWNLFVQFTPSETGVYTFTVEGDDAVDISIDDTVIASHYGGHGVYSLGSHTGTVSMVAGQTVLLNGRGEEGGGGEGFRVFWKKPSDSSWQQDFAEMGQTSSCDCDGNQLDECGICGGDGIADGDCDCDGNVNDECGICGGSGIPDGDCDCDGNSPTVINCPDDITVECLEDVMDCNVNDVTTVPLGASIICSQGSLVGDECNGTITNTYTVTDACGTHSCTQTITIMDTTAPELTIPEDYTAECSDEHPMDDASATDNCGEVTIDEVETIIPGSGSGCYTITRTFTATDNCGNATSATQTIAIVDTTPPVWDDFEPNVTVECTDGDENSIL